MVPKFQSPTRQLPSIFSQFSPAMAEGRFSTFVHLIKFIETLAVNYDWTEAFMMYIAFLLGFIYSEIISTESF